jgi:MFS transporter, FHS family, L-fucose permease
VQWTYLAVGCFVFLLAIVFYFAPIPEVTDSDMADGEEQNRAYDTGYQDKPLHKQYILFWGVMAQFCYVGSQVAIANYFINYVQVVRPGTSQATASNLLAMAQGLFAIGRFTSSLLLRWIRPRYVLWLFMTMIIIFISCAIGVKGNGGIATLALVLFFESTCFPTIFTLSLRGLGRHTKRGGTFLVSSISGGAVFPPMLGAVADARGGDTQTAMVIPLVGFVIAWSFPFYLNMFQADRLDGYNRSELGIRVRQSIDAAAHAIKGDPEKGGANTERKESGSVGSEERAEKKQADDVVH